MSIGTRPHPVTTDAMLERPHVHTRSCWWDLSECRWSGPEHPPPPEVEVMAHVTRRRAE